MKRKYKEKVRLNERENVDKARNKWHLKCLCFLREIMNIMILKETQFNGVLYIPILSSSSSFSVFN